MLRGLSRTSGSSLLRCPPSLSSFQRSYKAASAKPKNHNKHIAQSTSINHALGVKDEEATPSKQKRASRKIQTGSAVDGIPTKAAEKDQEQDSVKAGKGKKRRTVNSLIKDIEKLGPNIRDEQNIREYLDLVYNAKAGARNSRNFDPKRVHIVSKSLCDDTLERLKPSLEKHIGCDILDLNPGCGMWSSTLHDFLKPRKHILMEPDAKAYEPLLKPLLDTEGSTYQLVPKSGLIWESLHQILTPEYLPHQEAFKQGDSRMDRPNNTLLVVANLGYYPLKPFRGFPSVTNLVLYQFLGAARAHSLFHKYGNIRMLLWVNEGAKNVILPKNILGRKKAAVEAELTCSDIHEVVCTTEAASLPRDHGLELESADATLKRMKEAGITTPVARRGQIEIEASEAISQSQESKIYFRSDSHSRLLEMEQRFAAGEFSQFVDTPEGKLAAARVKNWGTGEAMVTPEWVEMLRLRVKAKKAEEKGVAFNRAEDLRKLEEAYKAGKFYTFKAGKFAGYNGSGRIQFTKYYTPEFEELLELRKKQKAFDKKGNKVQDVVGEFDDILLMQKQAAGLEGSQAEELQREFEERYKTFMDKIVAVDFGRILDGQVTYTLDNRIAFNQDPPLLHWDRRKAEPLKADMNEFYQKCDMSLLDIQPQPLWPILREGFPKNYDVLEYILSTLLIQPRQSVRDGFEALHPGAFDWLIAECPSITDIKKGGNPNPDAMTVRCLTMDMYKEILEAWIKWPFRPDRYELLSKIGSDVHDPDTADPL